jgi:hypothetical protein
MSEDTGLYFTDDLGGDTLLFHETPALVVRFSRNIGGKQVMNYDYYFKPNWYERFHRWACGYKAEWET